MTNDRETNNYGTTTDELLYRYLQMDYCITIKISMKEVLQHENVYNTMLRQKVEYFICKIMCLWG